MAQAIKTSCAGGYACDNLADLMGQDSLRPCGVCGKRTTLGSENDPICAFHLQWAEREVRRIYDKKIATRHSGWIEAMAQEIADKIDAVVVDGWFTDLNRTLPS
jgi:hypothetical protein